MKANKALKRLSKIETLMSDVAERFSANAPMIVIVIQPTPHQRGIQKTSPSPAVQMIDSARI
jgi:hypothetical protein